MRTQQRYLVSRVERENYIPPFTAANFLLAYEAIKQRGRVEQFNFTYKTAMNRLKRDGHVALYCKKQCASDIEAQVNGYWSIEKIEHVY